MYNVKVTEKQLEVLNFIKEYINERSVPPSIADIAKEFKFRQNAAKCHVDALAKKRCIEIIKNSNGRGIARGIRVLK